MRVDGDGVRVSTAHFAGGSSTPDLTTHYYTFASLSASFGGALESSGSSVKKYYSFAGQTVAMKDADGFKYFLSDHLGSTAMILDANGGILEQQRYLPFGGARTVSGSPVIASTDLTYTGQRNLPDTGLMDYRARFYSSYLNQFTQPDTIVPNLYNPQSLNHYGYVLNNPIRYNDPSGHRECEADSKGNCMGVRKLKLWQYAADTLNKLGGRGKDKDSLEAMARIVDRAAQLYGTYEKMMPELSEIFLGVHESNPLTLLNAAGADSCAALGREQKDCALNTDGAGFLDTGFNIDFQDSHNQVFHFWAYVATTASTDMPVGGYALGYYLGQGGNFIHENLAIGDTISGATWQDWALAQAGMNTGVMISFGVVAPSDLGDYIRENVGTNGAPYVNPLIQFFPLLGNMKPLW